VLERVAYHEAGHAIAFHRLGYGVTEARLHSTGGYVDVADCDYRTTLPARPDGLYSGVELVNAARPHAMTFLAGPVAEARHVGLDSLRGCWRQDEPGFDVGLVETWLRQVTHPDEYDSAASWLTSHAVWLVDEEWPAIERVAEALIERTVLSGEQVAELAEQHSPGNAGWEFPIWPKAPGTS
jgi:hypothetical protein